MFEELEKINERPDPFEFYTASDLWTDEHRSAQMLSFHLNESIDFCALSPTQREEILSIFGRILKPGGSVLIDVYSLAAFDQREEVMTYEVNLLNGFWSPNKYYGFLNTFKYDEEKVALDKHTIVESERTRTVYNWLQFFAPEDLVKEFRDAGFFVEGFYSDVTGAPYDPKSGEFAVIATKA